MNPEKTKWKEIQPFVQDLIKSCIKTDVEVGYEALGFYHRLDAYSMMMALLSERDDKFLLEEDEDNKD